MLTGPSAHKTRFASRAMICGPLAGQMRIRGCGQVERLKARRRRDDASQDQICHRHRVVGVMALAPAITHAAAWLKLVVLNLSNGFGPAVAADA
jgi:hypothetical protein